MSFGAPAALWALAALGVLLLFSLWRSRPDRVVVSSLLLWKQIAERMPPMKSARRPRFSLSLLLQALVVAAIVGAMADPYLERTAPVPRTISIVLDTSARMSAVRADGKTRFDAAVEMLTVEPDDRITLYWIDDAPRRWQGTGADLRSKLREIRPVPRGVDLDALLAVAEKPVWLVSDRPREGTVGFLAGELAENTGIVHASIEGDELFLRFAHYGPPREVTVLGERIRLEGPRSWWKKIDARDRLVVELPKDRFALDDRVVLVREPSGVVLRGIEHPALARVLQSITRVGQGRTAVLYQTLEGAGEFTIYVDPPGSPPGFRLGERFAPETWTAAKDHPLTRHMKMDEMAAAFATEVQGGTPFLFADGKPVAAERDGAIVLGFDLKWSSTVSFPIFWTNAIGRARTLGTWVAPRAENLLDAAQSDTGGIERRGDAGPVERERAPARTPIGAVLCGAALAFAVLAWAADRRSR